MEFASPLFSLYVFSIFFIEFTFKALVESWHERNRLHTAKQHLRLYGVYRLAVLIGHSLMLGLLFRTPLVQTLTITFSMTLLGCSELIFAGISNWAYARTRRTLRPLQLLYVMCLVAGLVALGTGFTWQPGTILNFVNQMDFGDAIRSPILSDHLFVWLLVFFLASIPANYIIRWLVNKPNDATFADTIMDGVFTALTTHHTTPGERPASAATAELELAEGPSLKGGRVIGVLERWIVIALLVSGELTAIGFVFTAKSIVRYQDFAKPDFAEYYLIGTLYSVIIALLLSTLI